MATMKEMSGETERTPRLKLNQIRINGQTGEFFYKDILNPKEVDGKNVFEETSLGKEVFIVFLKIRRKLVQFRDGKKPLMSQEHNSKYDKITLFGDGIQVAPNDVIRDKYPQLRTQQIIYSLYKDELVRVSIQGASLGSKAKPKDVFDFYSYISSFKSMGDEKHFYEYYTILQSVQERGQLGPYYCMNYKIGEKLNEEEMKNAEEKMLIAYNFCKEIDDYYKGKQDTSVSTETPNDSPDNIKTINIEESSEEINPADIPF